MAMTAFIALAVVGIDLGRLAFTATEVQTVADIAATAGAHTLMNNTYNGGTRAWVGDAQTTVASAGNKMDGDVATIAASDVQQGVYDFQTHNFNQTNTNANAVKATGRKTVTNFLAAAINTSFRQTDVTKEAIAPFGDQQADAPRLLAAPQMMGNVIARTGAPPVFHSPSPSAVS